MNGNGTKIVRVRAIDVGYFSTKYTLGRTENGQSIKTSIFPSLAPRVQHGVSTDANTQPKPAGTVVFVGDNSYFVGQDSPFAASGIDPRDVLSNYCLSDKYLALSLGSMNHIAKHDALLGDLVIKNLVVGLPFSTYSSHKTALAARLSGEHTFKPVAHQSNEVRRVRIEGVSVVVQPQGAVSYFGANQPNTLRDNTILIVDAGGGTLDWYLVNGFRSNWERSGAHVKAMLSCAYSVADSIDKAWRDNFRVIERIDDAIRLKKPSFSADGQVYMVSNYVNAIDAVLRESIEKMIAKVGSLADLDIILFTGGGAHIFADFFRRNYPKYASLVAVDVDPVFSNVRGFHIIGEHVASRAEIQ